MFVALLEAAPDAMVCIAADGRIVLVNAQAERLFGYERAELIGQPVEILVPDAARAVHSEHRAGYVADPRHRPMGAGLSLAGRRRDASTFAAEISLSAIDTDEGILVTAAIRDVTGQLRMKDLERSKQSLESFIYTVSHDLRAPLRALSGYSELLLEEYGGVLDEEGRGYAERIVAVSKQMGQLIDYLLQLSRISRAELNLQPVDLGAEAVDPTLHTAYVANLAGTVSVIDETTGTVTATVPVGADPSGVAVDPTLHTAYVTNEDASTVSVISVAQPAPVTTVTSSRNPSTFGQDVTFTATVGPADGGTITFSSGSTVLCRAVSLTNVSGSTYHGTCTTRILPADRDTITAVYPGDASYATSTGGLTQTVAQAPTALTARIRLSPRLALILTARLTGRPPAQRPARIVQHRAHPPVHPAHQHPRRGHLRAHRPPDLPARTGQRPHPGQLPRKRRLPAIVSDRDLAVKIRASSSPELDVTEDWAYGS